MTGADKQRLREARAGEALRIREHVNRLRGLLDALETGLDMAGPIVECAHAVLTAAGNIVATAAKRDTYEHITRQEG